MSAPSVARVFENGWRVCLIEGVTKGQAMIRTFKKGRVHRVSLDDIEPAPEIAARVSIPKLRREMTRRMG